MDIRKISKIDELIKLKQTGTPKALANKLKCSERTIYVYIQFMKCEMNAPIVYNSIRQTYIYQNSGMLCVKTYRLN